MEIQIYKEVNSLKVSFTINDQADINRAIAFLARVAQTDMMPSLDTIEGSPLPLSITYESLGDYQYKTA